MKRLEIESKGMARKSNSTEDSHGELESFYSGWGLIWYRVGTTGELSFGNIWSHLATAFC